MYNLTKYCSFLLLPASCLLFLTAAAQLSNSGNLYVAPNATLTSFGNLTTSGDLDVDGTLYLKSGMSNTGQFDQDAGLVILNGTSSQSLSGNNTFYDLTVNNSSGAAVTGGMQNIRHTLDIDAGTLTTNDSLTLLSDASGTARIAQLVSGADISGDITMERYIGSTTGWRMIGSAVSGATLEQWGDDFATSGFTGSTAPSFPFISVYHYLESTFGGLNNGYTAATNITNPITSGRGYYVYIGPAPVTIDVTGPAHKFTQVLPVTYTITLPLPVIYDGWNMVCNPYPSDISWTNSGWTKTSVNNAIYVYNPATMVYASYVSGVGSNGGTPIIPSSQAFWVKTSGLGPVLAMTESVKTETTGTFLKSNPDTLPDAMLRLTLIDKTGKYKDETVFRFAGPSSIGWDGDLDAYKLENEHSLAPYFASVIENDVDLSVNTIPDHKEEFTIPLRMKAKNQGMHSIEIQTINENAFTQCLYLEDMEKGTFTDLRSFEQYDFSMEDTSYVVRFRMHNRPHIDLGPDTFLFAGEQITLDAGEGFTNYKWSTGSGSQKITVNDTGLYAVEITDRYGCKTKDELRVRRSEAGNGTGIYIYPNPAATYCYVHTKGLEPGNYSFELHGPEGKTILHTQVDIKKDTYRFRLELEIPAGMYVAVISGKSGTYSGKLVIKK